MVLFFATEISEESEVLKRRRTNSGFWRLAFLSV
jgi:hypothetical protein